MTKKFGAMVYQPATQVTSIEEIFEAKAYLVGRAETEDLTFVFRPNSGSPTSDSGLGARTIARASELYSKRPADPDEVPPPYFPAKQSGLDEYETYERN